MHATIKHTILQGLITSIELDLDSSLEFCEACAKAKSTWWLFLKELQTQATQYRECIHWDILGPTLVKSLNRHLYVTAHIDDVTYETMLYFQVKKSDTLQLYKQDKALIETQSYNWIKIVCSDQGENSSQMNLSNIRMHEAQYMNSLSTAHHHRMAQWDTECECKLCYLLLAYHNSYGKKQWNIWLGCGTRPHTCSWWRNTIWNEKQ